MANCRRRKRGRRRAVPRGTGFVIVFLGIGRHHGPFGKASRDLLIELCQLSAFLAKQLHHMQGPVTVEPVSKRGQACPWSNLISCKLRQTGKSPVQKLKLVQIVQQGGACSSFDTPSVRRRAADPGVGGQRRVVLPDSLRQGGMQVIEHNGVTPRIGLTGDGADAPGWRGGV